MGTCIEQRSLRDSDPRRRLADAEVRKERTTPEGLAA